ncbi:MAG: S1 family peptidase [Anaerolineae bacterium]
MSRRGAGIGILAIVVGLLLLVVLPVSAITWGQPDFDHTNVGAMVVDWPDFGPYQWCSGTLVHPQVFLTAGHCTEGLDEYGIEQVWVNFHPYAVNPDTLLPVAQVITHPDYAWGGANPHDVGLLVLAEPVDGIAPAQLPAEGLLDELKRSGQLRSGPDDAGFTVVGYGGTLSWPPPEITYDDVRQYAESEYKALTQVWLHMFQNRLADDGGTCFGDSGGPAFWTAPDGSEILVGITSWGDAQCVATGFDYRVDIPETLDFVQSVISGLP